MAGKRSGPQPPRGLTRALSRRAERCALATSTRSTGAGRRSTPGSSTSRHPGFPRRGFNPGRPPSNGYVRRADADLHRGSRFRATAPSGSPVSRGVAAVPVTGMGEPLVGSSRVGLASCCRYRPALQLLVLWIWQRSWGQQTSRLDGSDCGMVEGDDSHGS